MIEFRNQKDVLIDYFDTEYLYILPRIGETVQLSPEGTYRVYGIIHTLRVSPPKITVFCERVDFARSEE